MPKSSDPLLLEASRVNYRLRSTFFYHKMKEYGVLSFPTEIANLFSIEHIYMWDDRADWGIGEDAFEYIRQHKQLHLIQVFCHPRLLRDHPTLLVYYRNVAALSQKSVGSLTGIQIARYEKVSEKQPFLDDEQLFTLVRLFNEHITLIIDSSIQSFTEQELLGLLLISTGAQIDGAWRNAIGEEAEKVVQSLLVKEAVERKLLFALIPRSGAAETYGAEKLEELLKNIRSYRGIMLNNQTSLLFSSEPDIALISKQGSISGMIEVKGGTDPAGALERYGAAKKSFEQTLRRSPDAKTILVASCITGEVQERIRQDASISYYFNLTEVISSSEMYNQFMKLVFSLLEAHP